MAAKRSFTIRSPKGEKAIVATPHEAAREAARFAARGTLVRSKSFYEQPEGAHGGVPVKLVDQNGRVVMSCEPSLRGRHRVRHTYARCDVAPAFKRLLRKRRRR